MSRSNPFICSRCRKLIRFKQEQIRKRLELREHRTDKRLRTKNVADLCRRCAREDADYLRANRAEKFSSLPCDVCKERSPGYNAVEKKWEYQFVDGRSALARFQVGVVHVECMDLLLDGETSIRGVQEELTFDA